MTKRRTLFALALAAGMNLSAGPSFPRYITLAETDRFWLEQAATACRSGSFNGFFQSFVRSQAVRGQYTAATITRITNGEVRAVLREDYRNFPIALSDYTYVAPGPQPPGATPRYLRVTFKESVEGRQEVSWVRVLYDGNGNDRDGQARVKATIGAPGRLTFRRTATCWELAEEAIGGVDIPR